MNAKNLDVKLTNTRVCIKVKSTGEVLLEGKFDDRIKVDESLWSVEEDHWLRLDLEKQNEVIWKTILRGDEEIDTKKVDNSKKMEEFDVETQVSLIHSGTSAESALRAESAFQRNANHRRGGVT